MRGIFFFIIFVSAVILAFGLAEILLLKYLNRDWWRRAWIRRAAWSLPIIGVLGFVAFALGEYNDATVLQLTGAVTAVMALLLELALMLSLPISGLIHLVNRLLDKHREPRTEDQQKLHRGRRWFLKGAAAAVPLGAIGMTGFGIGRSFYDAHVYHRRLEIPGLPAGLDGLRILHLSDMHLRHYVTLDDFAPVLEKTREHRPDLILMTGDIADDLEQLPEAIAMVEQMRAPLGAYAILGNHEYFRGVDTVRDIFGRTNTPIFVNEATRINHNGASLLLAGIDDPRRLSGATPSFFRNCLRETLVDRNSDDTVILMSHRPDALDQAAEENIALTLAGHTHGGQVGFMGRSMLENWMPEKYLWGEYTKGDSRLYTSAGVGHWFPFRLGCPPEAPIIEIVRA